MPALEPLTIAACLCAAIGLAAPGLAGADEHDALRHGRAAPVDIVVTDFTRSESALHDEDHDVYLVSNITNGPRDEDNSGFISRIAPDGQVLARRWIEGGVNGVTLNAPKGMTIARGVLYVADIDHLRKFDAATGAPLGSLAVPGSTFLNDVTSDRKGNVFFTDIGFTTVPQFGESGTDAVYKLSPDGVLSVVAAGNSLLNHPNGVAVLPNGDLKVATYDPFQGTKEIYTIDKRGNKRDVIPLPTGLLDGLVVLPQGFLVSSWVDFGTATYKPGKVYFVRRDGSTVEVASGFENPSDIGYDAKRNRLLVPELPDPDNRGTLTIRTLQLR
jgi:sugar lactone lactonase YvrE